jgi:hypothetical protein
MLIGEQLHSIIRTIQNQCTTDEQMDIISYFLSDSYKVTDFLSVEKGNDDDTVKFYSSKVSKESFLYTLPNPTIVGLDHEIYRVALKQMLQAEGIETNDESRYSRNAFFKGKFNQGDNTRDVKFRIVAEYPAWDRYDGDYKIIHLTSVGAPKEFSILHADSIRQISALRPSLDDSTVKSTEIKFGRFLNKVLTEIQKDNQYLKFNAKDIETFVNLYKAHNAFDRNAFEYFKVVEGEEIKKWYLEKTYERGCGTLNNSCMRLEKCQEFFDIYTNPENRVKMLILTNNDKLIGRCLLWETDKGKYMDRVYANDHIQNLFKKWAEENDYNLTHYRNSQSNEQLTTKIKEDFNKPFPYLDSFRFMSFNEDDQNNTATLYTQEPRGRRYFLLNETNGNFQLRN